MVSTRSFGGIEITIGKGGLRFKKRKSAFNAQIGKCMKDSGVTPAGPPGAGGRYSTRFQRQFVDCVRTSKRKDGNLAAVKATTIDKFDL